MREILMAKEEIPLTKALWFDVKKGTPDQCNVGELWVDGDQEDWLTVESNLTKDAYEMKSNDTNVIKEWKVWGAVCLPLSSIPHEFIHKHNTSLTYFI